MKYFVLNDSVRLGRDDKHDIEAYLLGRNEVPSPSVGYCCIEATKREACAEILAGFEVIVSLERLCYERVENRRVCRCSNSLSRVLYEVASYVYLLCRESVLIHSHRCPMKALY